MQRVYNNATRIALSASRVKIITVRAQKNDHLNKTKCIIIIIIIFFLLLLLRLVVVVVVVVVVAGP